MPKTKPVLLVVLDGWGIRAEREANAIAVAGTPNVDALVARVPLHRPRDERPLRRPARGADGELRGRPHEPRRRADRLPGPRAHQPRDRGRLVLLERRASSWPCRPREGGGRRAPPHGARLRRRRPQPRRAPRTPASSSPGARASRGRSCTPSWTAATRRRRAGSATSPALEKRLRDTGYGKVATVCGRYYAMDRDKRWDRVALACAALVRGEGLRAPRPGSRRWRPSYARGETDEFVKPTVVVNGDGKPVGPVRDGDAVLFFNFRADRAREITRAFTAGRLQGVRRAAPPRASPPTSA